MNIENLEVAIARMVNTAVREDATKIEMACEDALQGGKHGVYVLRKMGRVVLAEVSEIVPYGEIYEVVDHSWRGGVL
jgi:hypothetical protein